ncbi:SufE-like protein 2, chloroplastic, partial [Mucuna pruriens]
MASSTLLTLSSSSCNSHPFRKPNTFFFTPKLNVRNTMSNNALCSKPNNVTEKLNGLASEFSSLSEPIDRVKRLLHYATLLPPFRDSDRVPANRVGGCATQVWLLAEMDDRHRMRFRADSDSEISKGFCSCLVWMLDGAKPEEILMVHRDDLAYINVGLGMSLKAHSRINTWHNVFFHMQTAAKDFICSSEPP